MIREMSRSKNRFSVAYSDETLELRPVHNGILEKRGHGIFRTWAYRHFLLCSDTKKLQYFEIDKITMTLSSLKGEYVLDFRSKVESIQAKMDGRLNLFSLTALKNGVEEEKLLLSAPDAETRRDWIEAIQDVIHGARLINNQEIWAYSFRPSIKLNVSYSRTLDDGELWRPSHLVEKPRISFKPHDIDDIYAFVLVDLDHQIDADGKVQPYLHWFVVNIFGSDIVNGSACVEYDTREIENRKGSHRLSFFLFKQAHALSETEIQQYCDTLESSQDGKDKSLESFESAQDIKGALDNPLPFSQSSKDIEDRASSTISSSLQAALSPSVHDVSIFPRKYFSLMRAAETLDFGNPVGFHRLDVDVNCDSFLSTSSSLLSSSISTSTSSSTTAGEFHTSHSHSQNKRELIKTIGNSCVEGNSRGVCSDGAIVEGSDINKHQLSEGRKLSRMLSIMAGKQQQGQPFHSPSLLDATPRVESSSGGGGGDVARVSNISIEESRTSCEDKSIVESCTASFSSIRSSGGPTYDA